MPRIKDLERFKRDLVALSRETEVLAQWGETREDPPLPTEEATPASQTSTKFTVKPKASADLPPDFEDLLTNAPVGVSEEPVFDAELDALLGPAPDGEIVDRVNDSSEADVDLDSFLSTLGEGEEPQPRGNDPVADEPLSEESFAEETGDPDDAGLGGFDLGAFASAMEESSLEAPKETDEAVEPAPFEIDATSSTAAEAEASDLASDPSIGTPDFESSLEDFSMPDFSADEASPDSAAEDGIGESLESVPETPRADESFDMADLEDLGEIGEAGLGEVGAIPLEETPLEEASLQGDLQESPAADAELEEFGMPEFGSAAPSSPEEPPSTLETALPGDIDAFDTFSFDEPTAPNLAGDALDRELANLGEGADATSTFNLEGAWSGFGSSESGLDDTPPSSVAPQRALPKPSEGKIRKLALTEAQVDKLQDCLLALPLNLRISVEDIVANEKGSEAQRSDLVWLLVENAKAGEIASAAGKILKRRIAVPEGYARRTGASWLSEKGSLRYLLISTILPIARTTLLVLLFAGTLGYLGYRFIYLPLVATSLYRTGYDRIGQGRYPEAEDAFDRATAIREFVPWYYRYAEAYVAKRRYINAEKKYEKLLQRHPTETAGAMAWARLERDQLKYKDAITILDKYIIDRRPLDKDALLLEGDVFLDWAEEDRAKFEDARKRYATLLQAYGTGDLYLERMLSFFMRVDMLDEVLPLKTRFLAMKKNPLSAATLAELGGYLLDKKVMADDLKILQDALALDPELPETHYQLFRYYRRAGKAEDEMRALDNTIRGFQSLPALGRRKLSMYLESLIARGDRRLVAGQFLTAEDDFGKAAVAYENARSLDRLPRTPAFGRSYAGLGDVAYWGKDDLNTAGNFYQKAIDQGWDNPDLRYKRGFIDYRRNRLGDALEQFYQSGENGNESPWLLYALGNSFLGRSDWHAAEGYYRRLVDNLGDRLAALDYPVPQEKASDRAIVEVLMESQNNLGVSLFNLGNRTGNAKLKAQAVAAFTESARLFDLLVHDARSLIGANQANLGYLNLDYALHPRRGIDLAAYQQISKDLAWPAD